MHEFCFETVMSTERNILRVKTRVESGGHDVPEDKIITRYDKALNLVKNLVKICDVCHIYDNSGSTPFRIFKKRKELVYYDECDDWYYEDIRALTDINYIVKKNLN